MSFFRGLAAGLVEKLPLVALADVNGDGSLQLVLGPQPGGVLGSAARHGPDLEVGVGPVVLVLGVR